VTEAASNCSGDERAVILDRERVERKTRCHAEKKMIHIAKSFANHDSCFRKVKRGSGVEALLPYAPTSAIIASKLKISPQTA
jgi:hypothetical protein